MSWLGDIFEDVTGSSWSNARNSFTKAVSDVGQFGGKVAKNVFSFQANLYTLGAASKYTGVGKWSGTETASKLGTYTSYAAAAVAGGYAASTLFATPAVVSEAAVVSPVTAIGEGAVDVGAYAAYDEALAYGASQGVGTVFAGSTASIATGAGTTLTAGGIFTSLGKGLEYLGFGGLLKGILGGTAQAAGTKAGSFFNDVFGGSSGAPGSSSTTTPSGSGSSGFSTMLPIIIIIALLGFYLLTKKKGK